VNFTRHDRLRWMPDGLAGLQERRVFRDNFTRSLIAHFGERAMSEGYFVTPAQASQVEMLPDIYRRTMGCTDEVMLCEFYLLRGAVVPNHQHMNDQVGYVISGKIELTIGGQTRVLEPGDSYAIPGGIEHSAVALEDSVLIDTFSPPRDDYRTEAR
jgi:quercetin dioxygenase-like cupin family protein